MINISKKAIFPIEIKVWGTAQSLWIDKESHLSVATINKGGYSSEHYHEKLYNRFHVINGELEITIYRNDNEESLVIKAGQTLDVEPGLWHKMRAVTDCVVLELYWPKEGVADFSWSDIIRRTQGGKELINNDLLPETHDWPPVVQTGVPWPFEPMRTSTIPAWDKMFYADPNDGQINVFGGNDSYLNKPNNGTTP